MINTKNIEQARKEIQKLKRENKKVIIHAQDDVFNRKIFEIKDVDIIVGLEFSSRDRLKQRDSKMNEILAKLAKKNNIIVGVDIKTIKNLDPLEKGKALARLKQNITLCKRTNTRIAIFRATQKEAMSFITSLGGSTKQGKESYYNNI